jgi:hypothetical protein
MINFIFNLSYDNRNKEEIEELRKNYAFFILPAFFNLYKSDRFALGSGRLGVGNGGNRASDYTCGGYDRADHAKGHRTKGR